MNVLRCYRGDIFYVMKVDPITGSEQEQGRPAVIVSNDIGNEHANIVEVVYLTTKDKKPLPTHVEVKSNVLSTALCEQITTVSKDRLGQFIRQCTYEEMKALDKAMMISLGIEPPDETVAIVQHDDETESAAAIERDLYKRLYEQLLEKVIQ